MSKLLGTSYRQTSLIKRIVMTTSIMSSSIIKQQVATKIQEYGPVHKFPVPSLQDTLKIYLKSVQPFLNSDEYQTTEKIVQHFEKNDGQKLQKLLEERGSRMNNWLSDWWLNVAYLEYRAPVIVYSSPSQVFPEQKFNSDDDMIYYAANVIVAAVTFKIQVDQNKIPQEKFGNDNLDMTQYKKILGTCRQPFEKRDKLIYNPNSTHIVVVSNNNFYKLPVMNCEGKSFSVRQIAEQLKNICVHSKTNKGPEIGVLTCQNRDDWARSYKTLLSISENVESIKDIETSLFLYCLDNATPNREKYPPKTLASYQLIHGMGSKGNISNRWYDKTVQFIISPDGINGLTYEHSPSEGQPVAVLVDYIVSFMSRNIGDNIPNLNEKPQFKQLNLIVNQDIVCDIQRANEGVDSLVDQLSMRAYLFDGYGKDFIKTQKMSPDSYIQTAIQIAFYRLHKTPGAHYESASLRKFEGGRTECIRSCSVESVECAKTVLDPNQSIKNKATAIKNAIDAHKKYVQKALNGQGCDRHLLGLKLLAIENNLPIHDLYKDVAFTRSSHMRLSTSQVATKCLSFMCYGPLVPDGYGCCYNPRDHDIIFGLSSFKHDDTNIYAFANALSCSLNDMEYILRTASQTSKL